VVENTTPGGFNFLPPNVKRGKLLGFVTIYEVLLEHKSMNENELTLFDCMMIAKDLKQTNQRFVLIIS
jgi:hypothetical protein